MSTIDREALEALGAAMQALLPGAAGPLLAPRLALDPVRIAPTGLGGVVGFQREPAGVIVGRRLQATARVSVGTSDESRLDEAVTRVTSALVTGDRAQMRASGLFDVELAGVGPATTIAANGTPERFVRDVSFTVSFEHLQVPEEAGDVIDEIPLDLEVGSETVPAGPAFAFAAGASLDAFEVFDDPRATRLAPSQWLVDDLGRLAQRSAIWGGVGTLSVNKPGTYLVRRQPVVADFRLRALIGADAPQGIGLVFRWRDVDNFGFVVLQEQVGFRLAARKSAGEFSSFQPRLEAIGAGFEPGAEHAVELTVRGTRLELTIDGAPALAGDVTGVPPDGRAGFLCHHNPSAFFSLDELKAL
jgi:hypothetical protein